MSANGDSLSFSDTEDNGPNEYLAAPSQASQDNSYVEEDFNISYPCIDGPDFTKLPMHACLYCGIHDVGGVVKCSECDRWFCNGKGKTSGAHILQHLIRSHHKEIEVHPESPIGGSSIECYHCEAKNIFVLGFIPSKDDNVIVILCRNCSTNCGKSENWNNKELSSLISNRSLLPWLVKFPSRESIRNAFKISASQIRALEELWTRNPKAVFSDLNNPENMEDVEPVRQVYEDGYCYREIFSPLIQLEADFEKSQIDEMTQTTNFVKWTIMKENGTTQATFAIDNFEETGIRVTVGEDITLSHSQTLLGDLWSEKGRLIQVPDHRSGDFVLEFTKLENMPQSSKIHYNVDFHWSPMSYVRMCSALKTMAHKFERTSPFIYKKLMGHCVSDLNLNVNFPRTFSVNGLPQLNQSQIYAVKRALVKPLSLIQGPPGTGKTITSASLVYHIVKQTKGKVLVCAPSNVAVDHLAEKLHQTGLKVIRFCAKSREDSQTSCQFLTLHSQLSQIMEKNESLSVKDLRKNIADAYLSKDKRIIKKIEETEMMLLKNADVICCTCITSGNDKLKSLNFEAVLIDECSQGTEPQIMVPIVKAKNQLILVGDHCQLGPVVKCIKADAAGLSQTLFERLMLNGNIPIRLQVQYRMHPAMSTFPSNVFYEGSLQNGVSSYDRTYDNLNHIWPVKDKPVLFWHVNGKEDISSNGTSYINRTEAINVEIMASTLINAGILPNQIGIITPYAGQSIYLARQMSSSGSLNSKVYEEIEIANVDGFQGREKDIIIFSCVRGNEYNGIGFLSDPRRLNVALTRARYGLVIIGNANILSQNVLWNHLIHHCKYQGYLMEGNISTLRPCNFNLPSEKSLLEFFRKHSRFVSTALTKTLPIKLQTIDLSKTYTTEIQNPNSLLHNQMYKQYVPFKSFLNHSQPTLNGIYPAELEDKKALRKRGKMKAEDRDDCESMHSQMSFTTPNLSQLPY